MTVVNPIGSDTLQSVTDRGATTTNAITINNTLDINGDRSQGIQTVNRVPVTPINATYGTSKFKATHSGDMGDGFGVGLTFAIQDNAGIENIIGDIQIDRVGADNTSVMTFATYNAGVQVNNMYLHSNGYGEFTTGVGSPIVSGTSTAGITFKNHLGDNVALFGAGGSQGATFYDGVTLNTMTQGSVLFAGSSGLISQDNTNFFWDDTNNRLGIGTVAPQNKLHLSDGNAVASGLIGSGDYELISTQNSVPGFSIISADNTATAGNRAVFKGVRTRGTLASPTAPLAEDNVLSLLGVIYDGSAGQGTAMVSMTVDGVVSSGVAPQRIGFFTSPTNAAGRVERMTIKSDGKVGIGTTNPGAKLDVAGQGYFNSNIVARSGALVFPDGTEFIGGYDGNADRSFFFSGIISGGSVTARKPMFFDALTQTFTAGASGNPALSIDSSGNVGIGTTSPAARLAVVAGGTGYNNAFLVSNSSNVPSFIVTDNGNVGVGGAIPSTHVVTSGYRGLWLNGTNSGLLGETTSGYKGLSFTANATRGVSGWVQQDTGRNSFLLGLGYEASNNGLTLYRATAGNGGTFDSLFSVNENGGYFAGNVGIGNVAPSAKLHTISTTEQVRTGYDTSNYFSTTVSSVGLVTLNAVGTGSEFLFSDRVRQPGTMAEIYVADGSTAQSIPTGATYTKLTAFTTNGTAVNATADATNDKITITKAGKYLVTCTVSGADGATGAEFKMALFYDGAEQNNIHSTNKFNTGSEIDSMEMSGILVSAANKDIDVRLKHGEGGSVNFTTQYANLTAVYLGE